MSDKIVDLSVDLTTQIMQHLTPHLMLPFLAFIKKQNIFPAASIAQLELQSLQKTKMFDAILAIDSEINAGLDRADLEKQRDIYAAELETAKNKIPESVLKYLDAFNLSIARTSPPSFPGADGVVIPCPFTPALSQSCFNDLYTYGVKALEFGQYQNAARALYLYVTFEESRLLQPSALWLTLEASLLSSSLTFIVIDTSSRIRSTIDGDHTLTLSQQNAHRVKWIVWLLAEFIYTKDNSQSFTHIRTIFSELISAPSINQASLFTQISNDKLLNSILFAFPELLRYFIICGSISNKLFQQQPQNNFRRPPYAKDLVRLLNLQFGSNLSSDPIVRFYQQAFIRFDFQSAIATLNEDVPKAMQLDLCLSIPYTQTTFYEAIKVQLQDTVLKLYTNLTDESLEALLPLNLPLIDNKMKIPTPNSQQTQTDFEYPETQQQSPQPPAPHKSSLLTKNAFGVTISNKIKAIQQKNRN